MNKLYVVSTPIGNSKDITLRSIEILKSVDYIACEDTRVTKKLLNLLEIKKTKLLSYHNYNEKNSAKGLVKLLKQGKNIALVSDAGTPTISDPGYKIVQEVVKNNLEIEVLPGPSSLIVANILANFSTTFTFLGFLNDKSGKRVNQLKKLTNNTYIVFVSPHKLLSTLNDIEEVFGSQTQIFLGKEFTKLHETHYRGQINEVKKQFEKKPKGEFTLVFEVKKND